MMGSSKKQYIFTFLVLLIAASLLISCSAASGPKSSSVEQRIQQVENHLLLNQTIQERMEVHQVPGLSIAVVNEFELEWSRAYGVMELGKDQPVAVDTLFQAGSVAKPVTAVTALHFVEEGLIDLDENVNQKLVSWMVPENEFTAQADVTLRGLLSHTAGINQGLNRGYAPGEEVPTLLQALEGEPPANTLPVRVDRLPGTESYYSNGGYLIVVQLLEDVVGQPFTDITRKALFEPCGMASSTYKQELPEDWQARAATPHGWDIHSWQEAPGLIAEVHVHDPGYGGLWTTAPDLARFGIEYMKAFQGRSDRVLSQEMVQVMLTPIVDHVAMQAPYEVDQGMGFDLLHLGRETWLIHFGGSFPGYISVLLLQPDRGFGTAILTNSFTGYELIWEILYSVFYAYGIFPTTGQIAQMVYSALLFLGVGFVLAREMTRRKAGKDAPVKDEYQGAEASSGEMGWGERVLIFLVAASILVITFRYRGPLGGYQVHPLWKGAPWLTKGLLGSFFTSGLVLGVQILLVWWKKRWTLRERILYSLLVLGVLAGMFLLRDLWSVMFWG